MGHGDPINFTIERSVKKRVMVDQKVASLFRKSRGVVNVHDDFTTPSSEPADAKDGTFKEYSDAIFRGGAEPWL